MAIKIPDNLMARPQLPGGLSDGTENVTRNFGNRIEQEANSPTAPQGWGGVANQAAGMEYQAAGQAAKSIASSIEDAVTYIDNVKAADEDSRQKSMFLKINEETQKLRETQNADPLIRSQSVDAQQKLYDDARNDIINSHIEKESFSNSKIIKYVNDSVDQFKSTDGMDYNNKVLVPQMVQARKQRDGADVESIVGTAMATQSPESSTTAVKLINDRFSSPDALATYGAVNAEGLRVKALDDLQKNITTAALKNADDVFANAPKALGLTGLITSDALTQGPLAALIVDRTQKLDNILISAGASEGERLIARENYQKTAMMNAKAAITTHNEVFKTAQKEQTEANVATVTTMGDMLSIAASSGKATSTLVTTSVNNTLRSLGIDPVAAAEGRLTDPQQVKSYHAIITQVSRVTEIQKRTERENASAARQIETLRLQREQSIMPSTQKGSDLSFTDFQKQNGLTGKNPLTYTAQETDKMNAYLQRTSPTHIPKELENAVNYSLNSNDPTVVKAGLAQFNNLAKNFPGLAAQVDIRTREVAQRVSEGQDPKTARLAVDQQALKTPEQKKADSEIASRTVESWKRGNKNPLAIAMGTDNVQPAVQSLFNREFTDAIARGESPKVAKDTALARTRAKAGPTSLMSGDGSTTMSVNSPEVRFNVGVEQGPGFFGKLFGAPDNPNVVTNDALRQDIDGALKANGIANTKYFVGQPVERGGKPYYPILLLDENGAHTGPALDKKGNVVLWTFDANDNPVMNKRRESIAKDAAIAEQKLKDKAAAAEAKTKQDERDRNDPVLQKKLKEHRAVMADAIAL